MCKNIVVTNPEQGALKTNIAEENLCVKSLPTQSAPTETACMVSSSTRCRQRESIGFQEIKVQERRTRRTLAFGSSLVQVGNGGSFAFAFMQPPSFSKAEQRTICGKT
eukprot:3700698-Amphidinium_carterae.1